MKSRLTLTEHTTAATTLRCISTSTAIFRRITEQRLRRRALGWEGGSVEKYAPGKCIGGSSFGNYEGLLPQDEEYYECDINTLGKSSRGAERLVYTDDGYIYYTGDHYERAFDMLYEGGGEE